MPSAPACLPTHHTLPGRDRADALSPTRGARSALARAAALAAAILGGLIGPAIAPPAFAVDLSADTAINLDGTVFYDHEVALDVEAGSPSTIADLGDLPEEAELDAYHLGIDGNDYFSLDVTVELPGAVVAAPGDLVCWDGAVYTLAFDASDHGLGAAVDLDAATRVGSTWLLSFDTTVRIGATTYRDEDVVAFDGATFSPYVVGASVGVPSALDLDGLHAFPGSGALAVTFDGSGSLAGHAFDDEDVLLLPDAPNAGADAWQLLQDSSSLHPAWASVDAGAIMVPEPGVATGLVAGAVFLCLAARRRRGPRQASVAVTTLLGAIGLLLASAPAQAVDGVLEINQACAVHTGCFAGDTPGFPVTITAAVGRSVRLTSDLEVSTSVSAIEITPEGVTVDLNGFALRGPSTCSGDPGEISCAPLADGSGVFGPAQTVVSNGRIEGFGTLGIWIVSGRVERVVVTGNAKGGIVAQDVDVVDAGHGSLILESFVSRNAGNAIQIRNGMVSRSVVFGNRGYGILMSGGGSVLHSDVSQNGFDGIQAASTGDHYVVAENRIHGNGGTGLLIRSSCLIRSNVAHDNAHEGIVGGTGCVIEGNSVRNSGGDGILAVTGSVVRSNTSSGNGGHGLNASESSAALDNVLQSNSGDQLHFRAGTRSQYRGNTIHGSAGSTVGFAGNASAINRGSNTCNGSVVCP